MNHNVTQNCHYASIKKQRETSRLFMHGILNTYKIPHNSHLASTLFTYHSDIFNYLHSKIFPDTLIAQFTEDLFTSFIKPSKRVNFFVVLTDTTVLAELTYFMRFIKIFKEFEDRINVRFMLINWPQLDQFDSKNNKSRFLSTAKAVKELLKENIGLYNYSVEEFSIDNPIMGFNNNLFDIEFHKTMQAIDSLDHSLYHHKTTLEIDIDWITHFYEREESFHNLGSQQAIFDLAIRRSIGAYMTHTCEQPSFKHHASFLITSELNKRFLKCYTAISPIINIDVS